MKKVQGFSLIEILIVVALLGIISAFAFSNYLQHVKKTKRQEAWNLLEKISWNETMYFRKHKYYSPDMCLLDVGVLDCGNGYTGTNSFPYPSMLRNTPSDIVDTYFFYISVPESGNTTYAFDTDRDTADFLANDGKPLPQVHMYEAYSAYIGPGDVYDEDCYLLRIDSYGNRIAFDFYGKRVSADSCS